MDEINSIWFWILVSLAIILFQFVVDTVKYQSLSSWRIKLGFLTYAFEYLPCLFLRSAIAFVGSLIVFYLLGGWWDVIHLNYKWYTALVLAPLMVLFGSGVLTYVRNLWPLGGAISNNNLLLNIGTYLDNVDAKILTFIHEKEAEEKRKKNKPLINTLVHCSTLSTTALENSCRIAVLQLAKDNNSIDDSTPEERTLDRLRFFKTTAKDEDMTYRLFLAEELVSADHEEALKIVRKSGC